MKKKLLALILLSVFILSACSHKETTEVVPPKRNQTNQLIVETPTVEPAEVNPSSKAPATLTYDVTAYLENESITVTDADKLLEITKNCIVPLPESEKCHEPFRAHTAKEDGLLIHIECSYEIEFPIDFSSIPIDYPITSCEGKRLYLAIGPSDWIGIQKKENPNLFVAGYRSEENIVEILSCLELSEQQKEYILSMKPEITEPDFENDITITAYSKGKEIEVTDATSLLQTAEVCSDYDQQFNTVLFIDSLEELKSEELWIHISYKNGRNIYPSHSLGPHAVSDLYIIIGNYYYVQSCPLYDGFDSLMGFRYVEGIDDIATLRSCVALE